MEDGQQLRGITPPNSLEAERSVLGAMLQDNAAVLQAAEDLEDEDFYTPAHKEIYSAMLQLHRDQSPVDLVTVDAELSRRGTLEGVGGTAYLIDLFIKPYARQFDRRRNQLARQKLRQRICKIFVCVF